MSNVRIVAEMKRLADEFECSAINADEFATINAHAEALEGVRFADLRRLRAIIQQVLCPVLCSRELLPIGCSAQEAFVSTWRAALAELREFLDDLGSA